MCFPTFFFWLNQVDNEYDAFHFGLWLSSSIMRCLFSSYGCKYMGRPVFALHFRLDGRWYGAQGGGSELAQEILDIADLTTCNIYGGCCWFVVVTVDCYNSAHSLLRYHLLFNCHWRNKERGTMGERISTTVLVNSFAKLRTSWTFFIWMLFRLLCGFS